MSDPGARRRAFAIAGGLGLAVGLAALAVAERAGSAGRPLLDLALLDAARGAGAALHRTLWYGPGGWLALLAIAAGVAALAHRPEGRAAAWGLAALGLGWAGQGAWLAGSAGLGGVLLAGAAAAWLARRGGPGEGAVAPRREAAWTLALLGVFAVWSIHRLAVVPGLFFDEIAYLRAAQMRLGLVAAGAIDTPLFPLYDYERFRAQPLPLALQALAAGVLSPSLLTLRLGSVLAAGLALWAAAAALRARVGGRVALGLLALAATSPFLLAYGRTAFYVALSLLHGVLCFAATLALAERGRTAAAVRLGVLLGVSVYLYQVSWFAPLLSAAAWLAAAGPSGLRRAARPIAVVAVSALLVAAPAALLLREPFRALGAQTFDKVFWHRAAPASAPALVQLLVPEGVDAAAAEAALGRTLETRRLRSRNGRAVVSLAGPAAAVDTALRAAGVSSWRRLADSREPPGPLGNLRRALANFFVAPHFSFWNRLVDVAILPPLLAPLLLLGGLEALRRRRDPTWRALLAWTIAAFTVPVALTGSLPRRAVLVLPWIQALMALPVLAVAADVARAASPPRWAVGLATALGLAVVWSSGAALYFDAWDDPLGPGAAAPNGLEVAQLVRGLPPGEPVRLLPALAASRGLLEQIEPGPFAAGPRSISVAGPDEGPRGAVALTCAQGPPLTWIGAETAPARLVFEALESAFEAESIERGSLRAMRVRAPRPGRCARADAAREGSS